MNLKKYRSIIAISFGSLLVTMSCDKNPILSDTPANTSGASSANPSARVTDYTFDGTEGDPISLDSTAQWIQNYQTAKASLSAHFFGRKILERLLNKNNSTGLRFYYSLDNSANPTLLVKSANSKGNDLVLLFEARGKKSAVDLNAVKASIINGSFTDTDADSVSATVSKNWIDNYYQKNPKGIQAHFFGYEIIKQILSENGCVGIRAYYALNGAGVQQLLLIGVDSNGENLLPQVTTGNGRVTDGSTNVVADMSVPCPSYCGSGTM